MRAAAGSGFRPFLHAPLPVQHPMRRLVAPLTPTPTPRPSPRAVPSPQAPSAPTARRGLLGMDRRPLAIVLFSVIACGLLVAAASIVPLATQSHHAGSLHKEKVEPTAYAMKATADVSRLATLPELPEADLANLTAADSAALAALHQQIDEAKASLESALADAAAALPEVPADYLPGTPVNVDLPAAEAFPLPSMPVPDLGLGSLQLQAAGVSASPVGPRSGSPLDALSQLQGLNDQLNSLLEGTPVGELGVGDLTGTELLSGTPLGSSSVPEQAQTAQNTADPDEQGALAASLHAQSALDATQASYSSAVAQLQALLALYNKLAATVQEAIAHVHELQDGATADIEATLQQRLADVKHQVAALEAQASAVVAVHAKAVSEAQRTAAGAIGAAASAQSALVAGAGQSTVQDLQRQALAIQADAQQRKDAIQGVVDSAATDLGASADAQQALQAVQAAAAAATLKVDRDAKARLAALEEQVGGVQTLVARSQTQLQAAAEAALLQVNASVGDAVAGDSDVQGFLEAQAQSFGVLMEAREAKLALAATGKLQDLADAQSAAVRAQALAGIHAAEASLGSADGLVGDVQDTLVSQVGKDLQYVGNVSQDYSRVPTEDRKARAEHWSTVASDLSGVLDEALVQGSTIETLAKQAMTAAQSAEAQVSALK